MSDNASSDGKHVGVNNQVAYTLVNGHGVSTIFWRQDGAGVDLFETLVFDQDGKALSEHPEIHSSEAKAIRRHAEIVVDILGAYETA